MQVNNSSISVAALASQYTAFKAGIAIHVYWLPIIVAFGIVGNSLSLAVMLRPHNRRISCCLYMAGLAVSDNVMLFIALYYWIVITFPHLHEGTSWECKIFVYVFQIFTLSSIFHVVAMTIERFIAIKYPLKAQVVCTPKRTKLTMLIIFLTLTVYNIPYMFSADMVGKLCMAFTTKDTFSKVFSWFNIALNSAIPFTVILVLNIKIITAVRSSHRKFSLPDTSNIKLKQRSSSDTTLDGITRLQQKDTREMQLTVMLLVVSFAFLVLTLPQYIRYAIYRFVDYKTDPVKYANYILAYNISNKLYYTNNAVNFLLYCIGGSRFRQEVRDLFCKSKKKNSKVLGGSNGTSNSTGSTT